MAQSSGSASQRIVIAGGGVAGLTLAVALKQALGESFRIIVADPALDRPAGSDSRAYAVAAAARNMLAALGVWRLAETAATPMTEMIITDSREWRVGDGAASGRAGQWRRAAR